MTGSRSRPRDQVAELGGSVAEILLAPHRSYYRLVEPLLDTGLLKGLAHITGGGITDNLPRILPEGTAARVARGSWPVLPVFEYIRHKGEVDEPEMYRTFNMGIGMILVVPAEALPGLRRHFASCAEPLYEIGEIVPGDRSVQYS